MQRAAEIVGGKSELRRRLRVPMRDLEDWLSGTAAPPTDVFLVAVDIISTDVSAAEQPDTAARQAPHLSPLEFLGRSFAESSMLEVVEGAVYAAVRGSTADMGNLQLLYPEGLRIVAQQGFQPPFLKYFELVADGGSACAEALRLGRRVVISDVSSHPLFAGTTAGKVLAEADVRAVQSTPIFSAGDRLLGVLSTHYRQAREPGERELAYIDEISARAAYWLEREAA